MSVVGIGISPLGAVIGALGGPAEVEVTWNPSDKNADVTLSNGNRTAQTTTGAARATRSTKFLDTGKIYAEFVYSATTPATQDRVGMVDSTFNLSVNTAPSTGFYYGQAGHVEQDGANFASIGAWSSGDIIRMCVDLDGNLVWWGRNSNWLHSGDPSAGTGGRSITSRAYSAYCVAPVAANTATITIRSLAADFDYAIPTGAVSLAAATGV